MIIFPSLCIFNILSLKGVLLNMIDEIIEKGLVSAVQLCSLVGRGGIRILDATYTMSNSPVRAEDGFVKRRIAGASFFDVDRVSDHSSALPHMLPDASFFAAELERLGIKPDDLVVVYGQNDMIMGAARAWWMFRVFGHERVVVLDGGLPAWLEAGYAVDDSATPLEYPQSTYEILRTDYDLVVGLEEMRALSENALCPILDARPKPRFDGTQDEPRAGLRRGHIPHSLNVPAGSLVVAETGILKSAEELSHILKTAGLDVHENKGARIVLTCGSGVTACLIALALYSLGMKKCAVYDGSWSEWGQNNLDTKISACTS
jgi:thiosulfate/3-mercaptopyruvate sulfurtransferase